MTDTAGPQPGATPDTRLRISHPMNVATIHTADPPGPGEHLSPGVAGDVGVLMEAVSSSLVLSVT